VQLRLARPASSTLQPAALSLTYPELCEFLHRLIRLGVGSANGHCSNPSCRAPSLASEDGRQLHSKGIVVKAASKIIGMASSGVFP
jgi:hypothetical protein